MLSQARLKRLGQGTVSLGSPQLWVAQSYFRAVFKGIDVAATSAATTFALQT
jgi:hypothetical protein